MTCLLLRLDLVVTYCICVGVNLCFTCISNSCMKLDALVTGVCLFRIVISSWWIICLIDMKCPFYLFWLVWWSLFVRYPACFLVIFARNILFPPFYPEVSVIDAEVCFLKAAKLWILFSNPIHLFVSLYWGIEDILITSYYWYVY